MISVKNLKKLTIKDWAASILGAAVLALFFAPGEWSKDLLSAFSIMRIAVMVAFICLVFSYKNPSNISKSIETAPKFAKILMIVAPLVVLLFVLIQVADPEFAVWLVRCDTRSCGINFRHAIFIKAGLEISALVFFVASARKFASTSGRARRCSMRCCSRWSRVTSASCLLAWRPKLLRVFWPAKG